MAINEHYSVIAGSYLAAPIERLKSIHHGACVDARPDVKKLAVRLLVTELKSPWEWFLDAPVSYADVLGEEGLAAYRARLESEWEQVPPLPPGAGPTFGSFDHDRFTITHLREQLARASGSFDELVEVLSHDRSSPYQFLRIADELERAGREREALSWLERGVAAFPPAGDVRLRERLYTAYVRDGQYEDAGRLAERAFDHEPSAGTYAELRIASERLGVWPERRAEALAWLREPILAWSQRVDQSPVDGHAVVGPRCAAGVGQLEPQAVAAAALLRVSPRAVEVALGKLGANSALERSEVSSYERAVELLERWRDTLSAAGRLDEVAPAIARIRDENRRRPKLISMLDAHGLR